MTLRSGASSNFAFEVTDTDLMGRIGRLRIGGHSVETPCLIPVIHPIAQEVPVTELAKLGFKALMTNSLILYRHRREEALEKGLHRLLGFQGILMTDSGGYQVLQYGGVNVNAHEIAKFQSDVGSNLAVTLDEPTGVSAERKYAQKTVRVSLKNAKETLLSFGNSSTLWVGPVQGGLFTDLLRSSAKTLVKSGFKVLALGSPTEVMESYMFTQLVRMIVQTRKSMPFAIPLHLFGAGHPLTMPLSIALGCDTFDSASYILYAKRDRYMTERGTMNLEEMSYLPCSCPSCNSTDATELKTMQKNERTKVLAMHNLRVLREDVLRCKQAIAEGRLWDLVEERAASHPNLTRAFSEFTKHSEWMTLGTQFIKRKGLFVRSRQDNERPELKQVSRHLKIFRRDSKKAFLILSPECLPLKRMKVYAKVLAKAGEKVDIYRVHPQLGLYPAELEFIYPFTQTVASWSRFSAGTARKAELKLKKMGYQEITIFDSSRFVRTVKRR